MPDNLALAVYGRGPLDDPGLWEDLFRVLDDSPVLDFDRWGPHEDSPVRWAGVAAAAEVAAGAGSFLGWTTSGGTVRILDRQMPFDLHTWFEINTPTEDLGSAAVVDLFKRVAATLDANYGHVHALVPEAWGKANLRYVRTYDQAGPRLSIPPWVLELYVPGVYWGTILGPDYVAMFGADRIRSTPAAVVEELEGERFYLQATPDLEDCRIAHDEYVAAAQAMMEHLGQDAFLDLRDYRRRGRTPDFSYLRKAEPPRPYVPLAP